MNPNNVDKSNENQHRESLNESVEDNEKEQLDANNEQILVFHTDPD